MTIRQRACFATLLVFVALAVVSCRTTSGDRGQVDAELSSRTLSIIPFEGASGAGGQHQSLGRTIPEYLGVELSRFPSVTIADRLDLDQVLKEQEINLNLNDSASRTVIGQIIESSEVLVGNFQVDQATGEMAVFAKILDVNTGEILGGYRAAGQVQNLYDICNSLLVQIQRTYGIAVDADALASFHEPSISIDQLEDYVQAARDLANPDREDAALDTLARIAANNPDFQKARRLLESRGVTLAPNAIIDKARAKERLTEKFYQFLDYAMLNGYDIEVSEPDAVKLPSGNYRVKVPVSFTLNADFVGVAEDYFPTVFPDFSFQRSDLFGRLAGADRFILFTTSSLLPVSDRWNQLREILERPLMADLRALVTFAVMDANGSTLASPRGFDGGDLVWFSLDSGYAFVLRLAEASLQFTFELEPGVAAAVDHITCSLSLWTD